MKKILIGMGALFLLACIVFAVQPYGKPELSQSGRFCAMTREGFLYLSTMRLDGNWVYGVRTDGMVDSVYRLPSRNGGNPLELRGIYSDGDRIAVFEVEENSKENRWKVLLLNSETKLFETAYEGDPIRPIPSSVGFENGALFFSYLQEGGKGLSVERYNLPQIQEADGPIKQQKPETVLQAMAPQDLRFTKVIWGSGSAWAVLADGRIYRVSSLGGIVYPEDGNMQTSFLAANANSILMFDKITQTPTISGGILMTPSQSLSNAYDVFAGAAVHQDTYSLLAYAPNGNPVIIHWDGMEFSTVSALSTNIRTMLAFKYPIFVVTLIILFALVLLAILIWFLLVKSRRLAVRFLVMCAVCLLVAMPIACLLLFLQTSKTFEEARIERLSALAEMRLALIAQREFEFSDQKFYKTESYRAIREFITGTESGVHGTIFSENPDGSIGVVVSDQALTGQTVKGAMGLIGEEIFEQMRKLGEPVSKIVREGNRAVAWDIRPLKRYGQVIGMLVTQQPSGDLDKRLMDFAGSIAIVAFSTVGVVLILAGATAFHVTRPLKLLTREMEEISNGKTELPVIRTGKDEVGDLWNSMRTMAAASSIRNYEDNSTLRSYYRFVPRKLETLLGRSSAMEVSRGDMAVIRGNISILTIGNREEVRSKLDDTQFMDFVNECYEMISQNTEGHGGVLLSNSFDLSAIKILFPEQPDDGATFSLALLAEEGRSHEQVAIPRLFQLMHQMSFLYGVAGTEERAFPFLSSSEMDFLVRLCDRFSQIGSRLVFTEQYLKALTVQMNTRYIGFVQSEDRKYIYKLHEVLDAYNDLERTRRLQYDPKFQEAIRRFYQNDFYLARIAFSSMLKVCPEDGVARWYLFACEHYFNLSDLDQADYSLFGIRNA